MNLWWIGTISTLAGAVVGAALQAWREKVAYRRQLSTRWDQLLLDGVVEYLSTADRALRALSRYRYARIDDNECLAELSSMADSTFESLHEKSHVVTLLSGGREHPIRLASRRMREALLPLRDDLFADTMLTDNEVLRLVKAHRDARTELVRAVQAELRVALERHQAVTVDRDTASR